MKKNLDGALVEVYSCPDCETVIIIEPESGIEACPKCGTDLEYWDLYHLQLTGIEAQSTTAFPTKFFGRLTKTGKRHWWTLSGKCFLDAAKYTNESGERCILTTAGLEYGLANKHIEPAPEVAQ